MGTSLRDSRYLSLRWHAERPLFAFFNSVSTQALIMAVNIMTGVITARLLGADGRGIYAAVTLWPPLLGTLAVSGLNSAIVFRMRQSAAEAGAIAGAALSLTIMQSLLFIAVGIVLIPRMLTQYSPAVVLFAQFCLVSVAVNAIQTIAKQTFSGLGKFGLYNLTHFLPQALHLVALVAIASFATMTARNAMLALFISGAVATGAILPSFVRVVRPRLRNSFTQARQLASYSARASLMDVVTALAAYLDRLVLIPLLPVRELGLYAVAFSFSRVIQLVQPAILSVIFSHLSARTETGGKELHDRTCRFLAALLLPGCAILWAAGDSLLVFTYGAPFAEANAVFRLLVVEASLGVLSQVTAQLFLSRDRPGTVSAIQVFTLGCSIIAMLVLVPRYGSLGGAVGLLGAGILRWLLLLGAIRIVLRLPLPRLYLRRDDFQYLRGRLRR